MGCCFSKVPEPEGFSTFAKIPAPTSEVIDIMVSPVQPSLSTNVFEKQTSTPLITDVSFAHVDDSDTSTGSIDDEEIENLLNEAELSEKENKTDESN